MKLKEIFKYITAYLPFIFLINTFILFVITSVGKYLPDLGLGIDARFLITIMVEIFSIIYMLRYRRSKYVILSYSALVSVICFLVYIQFEPIVLIGFVPFIVYNILFEQKLADLKEFLKESLMACYSSNFFDLIFLLTLYILKNNTCFIKNILNYFYNFLFSLINIEEKIFYNYTISSFLFIILLAIAFIRSEVVINHYRKQHSLSDEENKVFWNSSLLSFLCSICMIYLSIGMFLSISEKGSYFINIWIIYSVLTSINLVLWSIIFQKVNQGGEDKQTVQMHWLLVILSVFALILLDQIESDLISILTWFLPILLPVFIGEINTQTTNIENKLRPTFHMKKHLYWLQVMCFNTLAVLNIISSLFTVKILENNKIIEENTLKIKIVELFEKMPSYQEGPRWLSNLFASTVIILISLLIAFFLSKITIWLLKTFYLNKNKGYFKEGED